MTGLCRGRQPRRRNFALDRSFIAPRATRTISICADIARTNDVAAHGLGLEQIRDAILAHAGNAVRQFELRDQERREARSG